jgi:hypothetical protein
VKKTLSSRVGRDELSWALDNAVAVRLKQWACHPAFRLVCIDETKQLQERISSWAQSAEALKRTLDIFDKWPNSPLSLFPKSPSSFSHEFFPEPNDVDEIVCAITSPGGWVDLAQHPEVISHQKLSNWLRRPGNHGSGIGDVSRLFHSVLPEDRDSLIRLVGPSSVRIHCREPPGKFLPTI